MNNAIRRLALGGALLTLIGLAGAGGPAQPVGAQPQADPPRLGGRPPVQPTPIPVGPYHTLGGGNPTLGYGFTLAARESDPRLVADGFGWAEFEVDWGSTEPSRGSYDWGNVDNIVNSAEAAGTGLILRVDQSPGWANSSGAHGWYPPNSAGDYGRFLGTLAAHVHSRFSHPLAYEIWNEPNISDNWGGRCPDPVAYTRLVQAAYPAIKAVDGRARVLAGSVTTVGALPLGDQSSTCALDDLAFIHGMYGAGLIGSFDALSTHPYGFGDTPEADPRTPGRTLVFRRAELQREAMLAHGDAAHHIWITEAGWAIDPATVGNCRTSCPGCYDWYFLWTPQQQAAYTVRAFNWARSYWDWVDTMVVFDFDYNRPGADQCHPFAFFGVYGRPAESALSSNANQPPATYTALPTATATATATTTSTPTPLVDDPPLVSNLRVSPPGFWRTGGLLTVQLDASDSDGSAVSSVQFQVTDPQGGTQIVPMTLVSGSTAAGTWQGTFLVPDPPAGSPDQSYGIHACAVEDFPPRRVVCAPDATVVVSTVRFGDVPRSYWAYTPIEYLAAAGIVGGYSDGTFRPANNATRAQFSKMIVTSEGWSLITPPTPTFSDVPSDSVFYSVIETAAAHHIISGYSDGTFRPSANITRGQITKLIALAEGWPLAPPVRPTFSDVAPGNVFYLYIEATAARGIISGYSDGTFRPGNLATRAQLSKMLYLTLTTRPTATPTATATPPTATASATPTAMPPTATGTATGGSPTATRTVTPTGTPPTATVTATVGSPTATTSRTVTPTGTPPTATVTATVGSPTPTATRTATATVTAGVK